MLDCTCVPTTVRGHPTIKALPLVQEIVAIEGRVSPCALVASPVASHPQDLPRRKLHPKLVLAADSPASRPALPGTADLYGALNNEVVIFDEVVGSFPMLVVFCVEEIDRMGIAARPAVHVGRQRGRGRGAWRGCGRNTSWVASRKSSWAASRSMSWLTSWGARWGVSWAVSWV